MDEAAVACARLVREGAVLRRELAELEHEEKLATVDKIGELGVEQLSAEQLEDEILPAERDSIEDQRRTQ